MSEVRPILCARCNVPVKSSTVEPEPDTVVSCPVCGESDTFENVLRESAEYFTRKSVSEMFKRIASTASSLTITEPDLPKPRFIAGDLDHD